MRKRAGLVVLLFCLPIAGGSAAAADRALSGMVLDREGTGLDEVSVFLSPFLRTSLPGIELASGRAAPAIPAPILVVRTGQDGAFSVMVPSGRYRVAAFKPGFDIALTEINVAARGVLELRLRESRATLRPDAGDGGAPDLDWILRRPKDDVLREMAAEVPGAPPGETPVAAAESGPPPGVPTRHRLAARLLRLAAPVDGELAWLLDTRGPFDGEADGSPSGRTASLALRGPIGEAAAWSFDGTSGRSSVGLDGAEGGWQGRRSERLAMSLDWRLSPRDALRAGVEYGTVRYAVEPGGIAEEGEAQQQTLVSLTSRWDRSFEDGAALYVDGAWLTTGLVAPVLQATGETVDASGGLRDSAVRARAGVLLTRQDHALDFGLRAAVYRNDLRGRGIVLGGPGATAVEPGESGGALLIYGRDDWRVTGPCVVNVGLGYHSNPARQVGYLLPSVGLTWEPDGPAGMRLRSILLMRLNDPLAGDLEPATTAGTHAAGRLGYLLGVEGLLPGATAVAATISYLPLSDADRFDRDDGPGSVPGGGPAPAAESLAGDPLVLTDGAAGRHELALEMRRSFGGLHGRLSGSVGRVSGNLAPALFEAPAQVLLPGEARYYLTRLQALYGPTETEVRVDVRRVTGEAEGPGGIAPLDYRQLDLVVAQDLPWAMLPSARLRLLMAYQGLAYASDSSTAAASGPVNTSRLTGGVAIRF
ncbi:MAG: hypothetical protein ACRD6R_08845 [Candidatus Polarisedimenticolia bacterium]